MFQLDCNQENFPLPYDFIVDHICVFLDVQDIISLRRVNKFFFLVTCQPSIWARILQRMQLSIPTPSFSSQYLEPFDFEQEQMAARAITFHDNWRNETARIFQSKLIVTDQTVCEMKILPGGKYLLASTLDSEGFRFYLALFSLDYTTPKGFHVIARSPTPFRPYQLCAKYMMYEGRQGIMTTYMQRRSKSGAECNSVLCPDAFKVEKDTVLYEWVCVFTDLESLGLYVDPKVLNTPYVFDPQRHLSPFQVVMRFESSIQLDCPSLCEVNHRPCAAMIQKPNNIIFADLESHSCAVLTCQINPYDHIGPHISMQDMYISAIRVLPRQSQILVVSSGRSFPNMIADSNEMFMAEIYELPTVGRSSSFSHERYYFPISDVERVHISDTYDYFSNAVPPPISILLPTNGDISSLGHYAIWPQDGRPDPQSRYEYRLSSIALQGIRPFPGAVDLEVGIHRALAYSGTHDGGVCLGRHVYPHIPPDKYPASLALQSSFLWSSKTNHKLAPARDLFEQSTLWEEFSVPDDLNQVTAITLDEGSGRICIAGGTNMMVLDLGYSFDVKERHVNWVYKYFARLCNNNM